MYHSLTFKTRHTNPSDIKTYNTWSDWHLIPSSRPFVAPPTVNEKYVEIPGRDGSIDCTSFLTGEPTYSDRKGSWEFIVIQDEYDKEPRTWASAYSMLMKRLHGKRLNVIFEDDPNYYYVGRFSVASWNSPKDWSRITINYTLEPYKINISDDTDKKL